MLVLRSLPPLALATLVACSSAAPTLAPVPSPSAPASAGSEASSGWTSHDPRVVRCGVDDRPRRVESRLDEEVTSPRLKMAIARPPVPPPVPPLRVDLLPMTRQAGGPVPPLTSLIEADFEGCASLAAADEPMHVVTFGLELASSGAPLRVLPPAGDAAPTPLVRCLMEHACQLQIAAPGQRTLLDVPMRVGHEPPPPWRVMVTTENPRPAVERLQLQLREAAERAMKKCDPVTGRARVRLSLEVTTTNGTWATPRRRRDWPATPPPAVTRVTSATPETLEGDVSVMVLGCVSSGITSLSLGPLAPFGVRTESLILTWNP